MAKRTATFQDAIDLERFTGSDYCESRSLLAFASNKNGLTLRTLATGEDIPCTAGGTNEGTPRFSWDGQYLLFLSTTKEKGCQMYRYTIDTGAVEQMGSFHGPIIDPMWSPDGTHVLFASSQGSAPAEKTRPDEPVVIENFGYKFDGMGYIRPAGHTHLFVMDAVTGEILDREEYKADNYEFDNPIKMYTLHRDYAPAAIEHYGLAYMSAVEVSKRYGDMTLDDPMLPLLDEELYQVYAQEKTVTFKALTDENDTYRVSYDDGYMVKSVEVLK